MPNKRVLYIEDDFDNQTLISLFVKKEPFDMITASNPKEAMDLLKTADPFDIIIVDLNLQEEGDGVPLIRDVRNMPQYASTPIFVFSGFDKTYFQQFGIDNMIQKFFRKPTSKSVLVSALKEFSDTEENQT